jgi:predicted SnoaL-like aldol condensation-catalyzing enzyme
MSGDLVTVGKKQTRGEDMSKGLFGNVDSDGQLETEHTPHNAEDEPGAMAGDVHLVAAQLEMRQHAVTDPEQLERNKRLVLAFNDAAINQKDFSVAQKYMSPSYIQHNPYAETGAEGLRDWIAQFKVAFPDARVEVKSVMAEGDRVMLHSLGLNGPSKSGAAVVDIFRVANGLVVEHWDVAQAIPDEAKNTNSMF